MIEHTQKPSTAIQKPKRPFGVSFLTIFMGIFVGIFPSGLAVILMFDQTESDGTLAGFVFTILLGIIVVISAIGTWKGNNKAKFVFLTAITVHYIALAYQNYQFAQMVSDGLADSSLGSSAWARVIRSILWIIICWLYFVASNRTKSFFTPSAELQSPQQDVLQILQSEE